jgi:endonuclease YncB( thermonuclease family)
MGLLPPELAAAAVRLAGIDAPERGGRAACAAERARAELARARLAELLDGTSEIEVCDARWDKYGGRIVGRVIAGGQDLAAVMMSEGLVVSYSAGRRSGWCLGPHPFLLSTTD